MEEISRVQNVEIVVACNMSVCNQMWIYDVFIILIALLNECLCINWLQVVCASNTQSAGSWNNNQRVRFSFKNPRQLQIYELQFTRKH